MALTEKQKKVLDFIIRFCQSRGYPPTVREVGAEFGMKSPRAAKHHLDVLEREGYVRRMGRGARAMEVAGYSPPRLRLVPLVAHVRAGHTMVSEADDVEGTVALDRTIADGEDSFLLRVESDAAIDRGIFPGDLVLVRPHPHIRSGDIVVAARGEEVTVRQFFIEEDERAERSPEQPDYNIVGKAVAVIRIIDPAIRERLGTHAFTFQLEE